MKAQTDLESKRKTPWRIVHGCRQQAHGHGFIAKHVHTRCVLCASLTVRIETCCNIWTKVRSGRLEGLVQQQQLQRHCHCGRLRETAGDVAGACAQRMTWSCWPSIRFARQRGALFFVAPSRWQLRTRGPGAVQVRWMQVARPKGWIREGPHVLPKL